MFLEGASPWALASEQAEGKLHPTFIDQCLSGKSSDLKEHDQCADKGGVIQADFQDQHLLMAVIFVQCLSERCSGCLELFQ